MSGLERGERASLTGWEQALRAAAALIALLSANFMATYSLGSLAGVAEFPFTANSLAKDFLFGALAALIVTDVRRWGAVAVPLLIGAHLTLVSVVVLTDVLGAAPGIGHTWYGPPHTAGALRLLWGAGDVMIVIGLMILNRMAIASRYDLQYLTPAGFRTLMAMSEVLVLREDRDLEPAEIAKRVDVYLAGFRAQAKWKIRVGLIVLGFRPLPLHLPIWLMSPETRLRWVKRVFIDDVASRRGPRLLRRLDQLLVGVAQQFCFFGYYGDERAAAKVGYVPFSQRPGAREAIAAVPAAARRVKCITTSGAAGERLTADVVIVGSGAGGAMLAYGLARRGREVLLLERGAHVDPADFTENEATQLSNLYADGAVTLSTDFRFHVGQGMCVGGSTVVNNAVCFDLPGAVLDRWLDPGGLNAGLDPVRLAAAFREVREFLRVAPAGPPDTLNPGARRILDGLDGHPPFKLVEANIDGCLGCGYCNIGCKYGKKLSALDWTLPVAQHEFPGAVRILADCQVDRVEMRGARATGVVARMRDGTRLTVGADTVVLSAGALASSVLLQRSRLGEGRAGQGLSFNMGSPVTLDFAERLNSERGLQISHYLEPTGADGDPHGLALESWFNPVVTQSLFMPGWFEEHWRNMRRYAHMTCLGVVVGTESNGAVSSTRFGGVKLDYVPSDRDFIRIRDGVKLAARIGLRADAKRALPSTFRLLEIHNEEELARIDLEIGDDTDISLNSSHPQGGNPMSLDALRGVVDPSFRVYGTLNVHVCDASVFPSSITVNPQLTVMALAAYAADEIAGTRLAHGARSAVAAHP